MPTPPDLTAAKAYLGDGNSWTDAVITDALAAETAAQAAVCLLPVDPVEGPEPYPADLAQALLRRVARNLAMRSLPLGLQTSMSEAAVATTRVGADPETRRLEAPYRRVVVG